MTSDDDLTKAEWQELWRLVVNEVGRRRMEENRWARLNIPPREDSVRHTDILATIAAKLVRYTR